MTCSPALMAAPARLTSTDGPDSGFSQNITDTHSLTPVNNTRRSCWTQGPVGRSTLDELLGQRLFGAHDFRLLSSLSSHHSTPPAVISAGFTFTLQNRAKVGIPAAHAKTSIAPLPSCVPLCAEVSGLIHHHAGFFFRNNLVFTATFSFLFTT